MKHRRPSRRSNQIVQAVQLLEPRTLLSSSVTQGTSVVLNTSLGEIVVQLYSDMPITTANFLSYVEAGTYNGTIFHRVTSNNDSNGDTFGIVQGGGFTVDSTTGTITPVATNAPITNEYTAAHPNSVGTIAMARTSGLDSATSQFFFNTTDNSTIFANYAVFGNVVRGLGIIDTIDSLNNSTSVTSSDGETLNPPEVNTGTTGGSPYVTINSATIEDTMTVTMSPNDAGGTHSVSFNDATNRAGTTISFDGANSTLTFTGTNLSAHETGGNLQVTGTNLQLDEVAATTTGANENLIFTSSGRTKHVDIGNINITGSVHTILGGDINLTGDIDVTGSVSNLRLLSSTAAGVINIDSDQVANAATTTINIPFLSNISIQDGGTIKQLIARNYTVTDGTTRSVQAGGAIEKVVVYGQMNAGIAGSSIGQVRASEASSYIVGQTINSVVLGTFANSYIYSTAPYNAKAFGIGRVNITGALESANLITVGNMGNVKIGSVSESTITAGYDSSSQAGGAEGFQNAIASDNSTIKSLNIKTPRGKGAGFSDSQLSAPVLGSIHLGRISTSIPSGGTFSAMGVQTNDVKSLVAVTDQKQSINLSNITSQAALNTLFAKRGININSKATVGIVAASVGTTTGLTAGDSYTSITLSAALLSAIPVGTVVTVVSADGTTSQAATLSAAAAVGDTSLTVTPFTANATYASGATVQGTEAATTTTGLTAGDSYTSLTLNAAIVTTIPAGTVVTIVSADGTTSQTATLSADADSGDTSLTVTPFTANATYAAGSTIQGTDAATTTMGLTSGDSYTSFTLGAALLTAIPVGTVVTIASADGTTTQAVTLSAAAAVGDTSLTVTSFTANADYAAGSTIQGTDAATTPGLTTGDSYSSLTLDSAIVTPIPAGTVITIFSTDGTTSQTATLSAAASTGATSLAVTPFTANADYATGATIQGTDASSTTTGLTDGDSYTSIGLSAALTAAVPAGTVVSIISGDDTQTATVSAYAYSGDTSLTVTTFTAADDYAAGAEIDSNGSSIGTLATGTTTTTGALASGTTATAAAGLASGDSYSGLTLNAALTTALPSGTVISIVSSDNTETATLSAAANIGDTSLTVTSFMSNDDYAAGSDIESSGSSIGSLADGISPTSDTGTLATGATTAPGTLASGTAAIPGTLASGTTSAAGLAAGTAYTTITLKSPVTAALASGASITIISGDTTQIATLSAAASIGDTSLAVTSFTPSVDLPAGSTIKVTGFVFDILAPASS